MYIYISKQIILKEWKFFKLFLCINKINIVHYVKIETILYIRFNIFYFGRKFRYTFMYEKSISRKQKYKRTKKQNIYYCNEINKYWIYMYKTSALYTN